MSDTPRTDALLDPVKGTVAFTGFCAEHARTLERENAAMREAIGAAEQLLLAVDDGAQQDINGSNWYDARQKFISKLQPFLKP